LMLFRFNVRFTRASIEPHPNERVKASAARMNCVAASSDEGRES